MTAPVRPRSAPTSILDGLEAPQDTTSPGDILHGVTGAVPPSAPNPLDRFVTGAEHLVAHSIRTVGKAIAFSMGANPTPEEVNNPYNMALARARLGPLALARYQAEGKPMSPEDKKDVAEGMAMIASLPASGIVEAIPAAGPLLGKWGSFLTGEMLGGGVYGSIRPLDDDESRVSAILGDASIFAATGGALKGAGTLVSSAFKRYVLALPRAQRITALRTIREGLDKVDEQLSHGGVNLQQMPPEEANKIVEPIIRQAVEQVDPHAIDVDNLTQREADRQVETTPRFTDPHAELPTVEQPVDAQFQDALSKNREEEARVSQRRAQESISPIAGTGGRGLEVTGTRATPAIPTSPTILEMQGFAPPENIKGVAVRGKSGKIYRPQAGEITHPQLLSRLFDQGIPASEFVDEAGGYLEHEHSGYVTSKGRFVTKEEATAQGLEGATSRERVVGPAVKGKSGKVYVGGATHPETMESAVAKGAPKSEFEGIDTDPNHAGRGFVTSRRPFVSREEAARLTGEGGGRLFSEDLHQAKGLPYESPAAAEANTQETAKEIVSYHGSKISYTELQKGIKLIGDDVQKSDAGDFGLGFYTHSDKEFAERYAGERGDIVQVLNEPKHPLVLDFDKAREEGSSFLHVKPGTAHYTIRELEKKFGTTTRGGQRIAAAKAWRDGLTSMGYDGVVAKGYEGEGTKTTVFFNPNDVLIQPANKTGTSTLTSATDQYNEDANQLRLVQKVAVLDAATDHAVANLDPIEAATPSIKEKKKLMDEAASEIHPLPKVKKSVSEQKAGMIAAALRREGSASEEGAVLELTSPTPEELNVLRTKPPYVQKALRKEIEEGRSALAQSLTHEKAPIEVSSGESVKAPYVLDPESEHLISPKAMNGFEIGVHLDDATLNSLQDEIKRIASSRGGFIAARLMIGITGSGIDAIAATDDKLSPAERTGLWALGSFMTLAAFAPEIKTTLEKTGFIRKFLLQYNPAKIMSDPNAKELFRQYVESMTSSRFNAVTLRDAIGTMFKDKGSQEAAMYAAEEGPTSPSWHLLSPSQQKVALFLNQMELRRGVLMKAEGVLDEYRENYVRHLLPPESFQKWKATGFRILPTGGAFTKPRKIDTLRELQAWAAKEGVPGPLMNPSAVYAFHAQEADRALSVVRLQKALEDKGIIQPFDQTKPLPEGWRPLGILGQQNKIGPDAVAHALENIAEPRSSSIEIVNSLDTIKGLWMRSIMVWPWEHGLNVLRSLPAIASNPTKFADAWKAIKDRDPGLVEAVRNGGDLFSRPDYGVRSHEAWQKLTGMIGLPKVGARVDRIQEHMDRWLWEQVVPSLQYFAYSTRMTDWAEHTKGKFLPGSAEYKTAARAAADFSNTVAGRIPQELTNPKLARLMRFAMFSPQWTTTRLALMTNAAGEIADIADGKLDPRNAAYLPFKMRQLAWGAAITSVGSLIMSGKLPSFNPTNSKFYMNTGMRNSKGQEIGVDMIGWWETDLQVFNHPFNFIFNRLNPAIRVAGETIQGRDYLGRQMTPGQTVGNILSSFGAGYSTLVSPIAMAVRAARGPGITRAELLQQAFRSTGIGATSVLPRAIDVATAKFAKKLLVQQGVPATDDNVFRLSILLKENLNQGRNLTDGRVIDFLAYYKRADMLRHPISSAIAKGLPIEGFQGLWQESRRVLAEF